MPRPTRRDIQLRLLLAAAYLWHMIHLAVVLYASPLYWKQEYHTSALSGRGWVNELLVGHPKRIKTELAQLQGLCGLADSKNVTLEEQVAIFLYICVTGMSTRNVGERFQRSNETVSKYVSSESF
ncbi:hypothetical protein C8R44DRAFT_731227 [Mycena epipterygia]|nr:hypothetical protein C8R44DRAFT_731227 [Mycena epipterygia]